MPSPAADPTAIAASLNGVAGEAAVQLVPSADVHSPPSCFPSAIAAEPTVTKPLPKTATSFRALPAKVSPDRAVQVPPPVPPEAAPPAPQPVTASPRAIVTTRNAFVVDRRPAPITRANSM